MHRPHSTPPTKFALVALTIFTAHGCTSRSLACNELACTGTVTLEGALPPSEGAGYGVRVCWDGACATASSLDAGSGGLEGRGTFALVPDGGPDQGVAFSVRPNDGGSAAAFIRITLSTGGSFAPQADLEAWVTLEPSGIVVAHVKERIGIRSTMPDRCGFSCQRATIEL